MGIKYRLNGDSVYKNRMRKRYTQEKLSELSGISRSQIQRIEKEFTVNCTIDTFMKISEALEVDWQELIYQGENEE